MIRDKNSLLYRKIGRNIKNIRLQKGLRQIELYSKTGLNRTYISRIERGKARVTPKLLYILVIGLGIKSSDLIEF